MLFKCTIPLVPVAKQGDRSAYRNGRIFHYQPKKIKDYESEAIGHIRAATSEWIVYHFQDEPIFAIAIYFFPWPKSWSKKKREAHGSAMYSKPDGDNLDKMLFDCVQKSGVIDNDARISGKFTVKRYDEKPRTYFELIDFGLFRERMLEIFHA